MQEKPKVVVSRTRRAEAATRDFTFTESDIRSGSDTVASYRALAWNAFKRLASGASAAEKTALFSGTASRVYRIDS